MKKIKKLTNKQIAMMPVYRKKWLGIGLSTEPVDVEEAKTAVCKSYSCVGLKPPSEIIMADSPIHATRILRKRFPNLTASEILSSTIFGCHDSSWLGFYEYFQDNCGIKYATNLEGMISLAKCCGWVNTYENLAIIQQRPTMILFDDQKRLHCDHGPSILYRDGFSVYSWHGTRIPKEWIEDKSKLTPKFALSIENIEQRRCACEILGWNHILSALDAKILDQDEDPMIGTLLTVEIPDIGEEKFLRVLCGTGREFAIPVPPNMKSAIQANAWTFGIDNVNEFQIPEIRT